MIIGLVLVAAWIQAGFTSSVNDDFVRLSTFSLVVIATPAIAWGWCGRSRLRGMITTTRCSACSASTR